MSLEKIDQYIKELEAVKSYDAVKRERDEALRKISELSGKLQKVMDEKREAEKRISEMEGELKKLREELKAKDEELQKSRIEINMLRDRVEKLENLKVTVEGKTLVEAEKAVMEAEEEEIKKRAKELFNSMKAGWEETEKPREVSSEAVKLLKHIVEGLSKPGPHLFLKEVAEAGIPEKVKEILDREVERRINVEFMRRVEEESERKALEKLKHLKEVEWPKWFRANVEPRVRELENKIYSNVFKLLRGPWTITCDRCGSKRRVEFTPQGVKELLRNGYIYVECTNPECMDLLFILPVRHKIRVELKNLISYYVTR